MEPEEEGGTPAAERAKTLDAIEKLIAEEKELSALSE